MAAAAARDTPLTTAFGMDTMTKIRNAKVLVVGAGGIGCELLKNLVLTGFSNIEVIDLDTIDVSNLNRQFLFRPKHVGMSKAKIARESALRFNPRANVKAYLGNVKDSRFGAQYIKKFDIVLNALDNVDARRHVNRLCLATDTPMLDSGTTGYLGQVTVIRKDVTECFECTPKGGRKVYPICTIRSTPDKPVHCVVWAKELFKLLFGKEDESYLFEADAAASSFMTAVQNRPKTFDAETVLPYARAVFKGLFHDEIARKLADSEAYKTAKKKPAPVDLDVLLADATEIERQATALADQQVLTTKESAELFLSTVCAIWGSEDKRATFGATQFDKDEPLDLDFVTAATNLRCAVFSIKQQSKFDVKAIAGNIIPAIATTNAIVAGLQVLEAVKVLRGLDLKEHCHTTFCLREPTRRGKVLLATRLEGPNSKCYVCSKQRVSLYIDTEVTTLAEFRDRVLKGRMGFNEPNIEVGGNTVYEEGEDAEEFPFEHRPLKDVGALGIKNGSVVSVDDFSQNLQVEIVVMHKPKAEFDEEKTPEFFTLTGKVEVRDDKEARDEATAASADGDDDDGDIMMVDDDGEEVVASGAGAGAGAGAAAAAAGDGVIMLDLSDNEEEGAGGVAATGAERNAKRRRDSDGAGSGGSATKRPRSSEDDDDIVLVE